MTSHIANFGSESMEWVSFGMIAQKKPLIPSINPTRFEKLLGFAPSPQATDMENDMPSKYGHHHAYIEDDMTDMVEEDVWGDNDDDMSSFDDEWPDSESDSHFSAFFDEGAGKSRVTGIFSPSQFSPVITSDREAMCGQIFDSPHVRSSEHGAHNIVGISPQNGILLSDKSFWPGFGPKSAPVEVPVWSNLCVTMKNGGTFLGLDVTDDDDDDVSVTRIPPHVLVAKQLARSQISAFSVIEGTGRTLKGRDVSKVRDAVWKQTGFSG